MSVISRDGVRYVTPGEVAEELGVSRQRVNVLFHEFGIKRLKVHARLYLISEHEVKRLVQLRRKTVRSRCR